MCISGFEREAQYGLNYTKKAGTKEFFIALAVIALIGTVGSYIRYVLPFYKVFGHIAGIIAMVIYGYFVLMRYCAVYTYYIGEDYIRITRQVGGRTSEMKYSFGNIYKASEKKPHSVKIKNYTRFVLKRKNAVYIIPKTDKNTAVMIEDDENKSILASLRKKG